MAPGDKPKTIAEYIAAAPQPAQDRLNELLACLREAAPGAEEGLKWGHPALSYQWILFQFGAYKNHIGFNPHPAAIRAFQPELAEYQVSSSTIRFPLDRPLPVDLIRRIAEFRVDDARRGVKWM